MAKDRRDCHAPKTTATTRKILLAEDDPDIRFILNLVLNDAGYEVEISDGNSIVEENHQSPDLFILDKALPTPDGLAICKYLKSNEKTKDIPIIMISCYHDLKRKAKKSGVADFIEKPFALSMLLRMVDKNINIHEHRVSGTGARKKS